MSQFIEDLLRPHVMDSAHDHGYQAMAADKPREAEAMQWCNAVADDMADEARSLIDHSERAPSAKTAMVDDRGESDGRRNHTRR